MNFKNWKLKRTQVKSIKFNNDAELFISLSYHCPKCNWGTDTKDAFITHLINHLTKKKKK